jgi:uncharacterized membrane protein YdjX (TVP38/TMEM64 family)
VPADRRAAVLRLALFGGAVVTLFVVATASGRFPSADRIRDWGDGLGVLGPVLFVPLSVALGCALTPGPVLAGAAGLLFGTALGTPIALLAAVLNATAELLIARYLAGSQVGAVLPPRVRRIDGFIERRGFFAVLYIRLAPGIPYHLVNYGAGLTSLRVRDMAAGTAVGALPRTFAYVALGGSLSDLGSPEAKVAIGLLVVVGILGALLARRQIRAERGASPEAPAR